MTSIKRLVSLFAILALALTFTAMLPPTAHAATAPAAGAAGCVKNCAFQAIDCLTATASFRPRDTNVATLSGTVNNATCDQVAHKGILTLSFSLNCPGTAIDNANKVITLQDPWNPGVSISYNFSVTGFCEVCTNGVPTGFPPFTIFGQATVRAFGVNNVVLFNSRIPTGVADMTNSPTHSFPCP